MSLSRDTFPDAALQEDVWFATVALPFPLSAVVSSDKVSRLLGGCEHPAPRITALESLLEILSTLEICLNNR